MKKNYKIILSVIILIILIITSMCINIEGHLPPYDPQTQVMEEYLSVLDLTTKTFIYITNNDCSDCEIEDAIINELVDSYDFSYIEINIDDFKEESIDDYNEFIKSNTYLIENELILPTIMVVKQGKAHDVIEGLSTYDYILSFLQRNSIISY